jgi:hypothetical protein
MEPQRSAESPPDLHLHTCADTLGLYERAQVSSRGGAERGWFVRGWWSIPIWALAVRRGRSGRGCRGAFQAGTGGCALSVRSRSARQASPCSRGLLGLEFAEDVVGARRPILRATGEHRALPTDARRSLRMKRKVGDSPRLINGERRSDDSTLVHVTSLSHADLSSSDNLRLRKRIA